MIAIERDPELGRSFDAASQFVEEQIP